MGVSLFIHGRSGGLALLVLALVLGHPASALSQGAPEGAPGWAGDNVVDAPAQDGRIVGRVINSETGQPVPSAEIRVEGTSRRTLTDPSGRFVLSGLPIGVHRVVARSLGFATKTVTDVEIGATAANTLDISLDPAALAIEGITVTAARERGSTAVLLDRQRNSVAVLDGAGAQEISRSPDSDAAEVARRLSGTTVSEGRYVFVRGMGERYSQTSLNGSPLPSPEPEREVVPLDLFPAGFLEQLVTQKTYTPDLPGDFTGGSVAIETRDYPLERSWKLSLTTSVNSASQFRDGFLSYAGGKRDFLGFDDGSRKLPADIASAIGGLRGSQSLRDLNPTQREQLAEGFQRQFTPTESTTPLNRSISASYGQPFRVGGRDAGFFAGVNYSDSFRLRLDEVERKYTTTAFNPDFAGGEAQPNVDYSFRRGIRDVRIGAVGNASVRLSPLHTFTLATTFSRAAEDEARTYVGVNNEDLGGEVRGDRLRFVARSLMSGQLSGRHQGPFRSTIEWRAASSRARQEEPALREAVYVRRFGSPEGSPFYLQSAGESARYFFSDVIDDDLSGGVDVTIPLADLVGGTASVKVGGSVRGRHRDFAARRFNWDFRPGTVDNLDSALTDATIVDRVSRPGEFAINEVIEPGDQYTVDDTRRAGYAMVDLPLLGSRLRVIGGARIESYRLELESRGAVKADRDQTDVLPALSVVYRLNDGMNLRAAYSRTLDRPEFRELAPFQFTEAASLRQVIGNSELEVARFRNYDLRWEWFPRPTEVLSLGLFYKSFTDPVEQVYYAAASSAYSFQNAVDGRIAGVEVDIRQGLDVLMGRLRNISVSGNVALIHSEVSVETVGAFVPTNATRPLEGQSPLVANLGINYRHPEGVPEVGLYYNVAGKRLAAAGGSGVPDIYERPRHQLDLSINQALPNGMSLRISAENLLGSEHRYEQSDNGIRRIQKRYSTGRTVSVGLAIGG